MDKSFELGSKKAGRFSCEHQQAAASGKGGFPRKTENVQSVRQACLGVRLASTKGDRYRNPQVVKMQGAFMIIIITTKTDKSIAELSGLRIREHHERCLE